MRGGFFVFAGLKHNSLTRMQPMQVKQILIWDLSRLSSLTHCSDHKFNFYFSWPFVQIRNSTLIPVGHLFKSQIQLSFQLARSQIQLLFQLAICSNHKFNFNSSWPDPKFNFYFSWPFVQITNSTLIPVGQIQNSTFISVGHLFRSQIQL